MKITDKMRLDWVQEGYVSIETTAVSGREFFVFNQKNPLSSALYRKSVRKAIDAAIRDSRVKSGSTAR